MPTGIYLRKRKTLLDAYRDKAPNGAPDACWEWQYARHKFGYGMLGVPGQRKVVTTHRLAWELAHGPIPAGLHVRHLCNNPPCCNPAHLAIGSAKDNMQDMIRAGRHARPSKKVSEKDVQTIRLRYAKGGITMQALADEYGLTIGTIHPMIRRKTWKHI